MTDTDRPLCDGPEPCACYAGGYAAGKDKAFFEMLASLEGPSHDEGCAYQPCQVKRACLQKVMTLMARTSPRLFDQVSIAPRGNCAASSPNCPTDNSGNFAACMPRASIPSATSPSSSPSQDQPSIAYSTGAILLSVRSCPLPESTRYSEVQVVLDNLNTRRKASLYDAFPAPEARRIAKRLKLHHTPKHGSWLNMAEIEFSIFSRSCLRQRLLDEESLCREVHALELERNDAQARINWRFSIQDARTKLHRLYPINS